MRPTTGQEMRRLLWAISLLVLLLVLAIIAYFITDITITYNRNIEDNREKVIQESVRGLQETQSSLITGGFSPELMEVFNQDLFKKIVGGDLDTLYRVGVLITLNFYPVDYVGFIADGELVEYGSRKGLSVDPAELSTEPPEDDYQVLDRLGGSEGFFISVFLPADFGAMGLGQGKIYANMIIDRSEEMEEIETYFRDQRNSLLVRLLIAAAVAIIASLLVTTFGLRHFTRKYVVDPIEKINRQAREIMEGTFRGEVEVDERSAYAPLQGLLRSGHKVLARMDEELRE
ncbi:MAG: hypothetical protein H5T73_02865 [Actinobacteria bacterium]|nr:hypothetical protein [Actinomycetota bacterium]